MDFISNLHLSDDRKVDVLLQLMNSFRAQIIFWHERAYIAATASLGLLLLITKFWIDFPSKTWTYLIFYIIAIIGFGFLAHRYLLTVKSCYVGNEQGKLKCEYALKLKDENTYFGNGRFFWKSDPDTEFGMPAKDIQTLITAHLILVGFLIFVSIAAYFIPTEA